MKNVQGILELVRPKKETIDEHLGQLFGWRAARKKAWYRDTLTGREYFDIVGSIAWPERAPGYVLVVGVEKTDHPAPAFICLDEFESHSVTDLLEKAVQFRGRWGCRNGPQPINVWHGDYERMAVAILAMNSRLEKEVGAHATILMSPPFDFERKANRFEIYLERILYCLKKDEEGRKRLHLGTCDRLRNAMRNFTGEDAYRENEDRFPPISALGYAVHALLTLKPWEVPVQSERLSPTMEDRSFEREALIEGELMYRELFGDDTGDRFEEYGSLVPTV